MGGVNWQSHAGKGGVPRNTLAFLAVNNSCKSFEEQPLFLWVRLMPGGGFVSRTLYIARNKAHDCILMISSATLRFNMTWLHEFLENEDRPLGPIS